MIPRINRLRTPQFARRKRRLLLLKLSGVVFFVLTLIGGFLYIVRLPSLQVTAVSISGNSLVETQDLYDAVERELAHSYGWLVPKRNIFFIPEESIQASVLSQFPRVNSATLEFTTWSSLTLTVEERVPQAMWCGENRLGEGSTPTCYFLDAQGFVYAPAPTFTGEVYLRFYGPLEAGEPVGQSFLTPAFFHSLLTFTNAVGASNVAIVEFALIDEEDAEVYLEDGTKILIDPSEDLERVLDNLLSVLHSDALRDRPQLKLEYLDLRFGNKVYYKDYETEP